VRGAKSRTTDSETYRPVQAWRSKTHDRSAARVTSAGVANAVDILDLIDAMKGTQPMPLQWYQCDVDDSGSCNPADVLGVVDLLNGASTFAVWNNVTLSGRRCPAGP